MLFLLLTDRVMDFFQLTPQNYRKRQLHMEWFASSERVEFVLKHYAPFVHAASQDSDKLRQLVESIG